MQEKDKSLKPSKRARAKFVFRSYAISKRWLFGSVAAGVLIASIVIAQLFVLDSKAGFNAKIGPVDVGGKTKFEVAKLLADYTKSTKVTIKTSAKSYETDYDTIGLHADVVALSDEVTHYPMWQRFIPFTGLARLVPRTYPLHAVSDDEKLSQFASKIAEEDKLEPKNAGITLNASKAAIDPAKDGYSYDIIKVVSFLKEQQIIPDAVITLAPQTDSPKRTDDQVRTQLETAQKMIDNPPKIIAEGKKFNPDGATVAGWLTVTENDKQELEITINESKLNEYIVEINRSLFVPAIPTTITLLDGGEIARKEGAAGRGLDNQAMYSSISDAVKAANGSTVTASLVSLQPKLTYNRTYSKTQKGLQTLLDDIVAEKGNYGISVRQLGGAGLEASSRGSQRFTAASTYKMFISYYLMQEIQAGRMKWDDMTPIGKNVADCFDVMIVKSDNACAEYFGDKFGWSNVTNALRGIGLGSSGFDGSGSYSNAIDETNFLTKLMNGELMSNENRERMLDAMKRQVFRSGVPAGAKGSVVADKVGFLYGYLNDAAVVYAPSGTYVITILTKDSSWAQIADATSRIHTLLN